MCCSQIWSPLSQMWWYQLWTWASHVGHAGFARAVPDVLAVPVDADVHDVADRTLVDLLDRVDGSWPHGGAGCR